MIGNKNSIDLDVGRRPKLKSDEFLLPIIVVIELTLNWVKMMEFQDNYLELSSPDYDLSGTYRVHMH